MVAVATPMPELAAIIARLRARARLPGGRSAATRRRHHRSQLPRCAWAARISSCACATTAPRCWASIAPTEEIASRRAAAERIAPAVVAFLSDVPALVPRRLPGGGVPVERCARPVVMAQVAGPAAALARHAGAADGVRRLPPRRVTSAGWRPRCPTATRASSRLSHRIEAALTGPEHVPVSCHNDLLTANFVRDGARVCIVDWEYAGMNNRYFDLGNLSVNNGFEADGRPRAARVVLRGAGPPSGASRRCTRAHRSPTSARRCGASSQPRPLARSTSTTPPTRPSTSTGSSAPRWTRAWRSGSPLPRPR